MDFPVVLGGFFCPGLLTEVTKNIELQVGKDPAQVA